MRSCFKFISLILFCTMFLVSSSTAVAATPKAQWTDRDGGTVYIREDGTLAKGVVKIEDKIYFFNEDGKLDKGKKGRILEYKGNFYDVRPDGTCRRGWNTYNRALYYFGGADNSALKDAVVDKVKLMSDGKAYMSLDASVKYKAMNFLKKATSVDASRRVQLRRAFNLISNRKYFQYVPIYPDFKSNKWIKDYANRMFTTKEGNCYGHCAIFAAVADLLGYDPYIVAGTMPEITDGATGKTAQHGVVKIDNKYYELMGWSDKPFAMDEIKYSFKSKDTYRFKDEDGTGPVEIMEPKSKNLVFIPVAERNKDYKVTIKKCHLYVETDTSKSMLYLRNIALKTAKNYYYFNKKGKSLEGIHKLGDKLFDFSRKTKIGYAMKSKDFDRMQKLSTFKAPFAPLKDKLGEEIRFQEFDNSCFMGPDAGGKERLYFYKNIKVGTYIPEGGAEIIISIGSSKKLIANGIEVYKKIILK